MPSENDFISLKSKIQLLDVNKTNGSNCEFCSKLVLIKKDALFPTSQDVYS